MEIDFNGIIHYPWRSAIRNFKYESCARMSRIILLLAWPTVAAHTSDVLTIARLYARTITSWEEPYYSGRPRDTSCEYRDCDTDGTKSFSVIAVIMRGILPLEVFQLRHSAGASVYKRDLRTAEQRRIFLMDNLSGNYVLTNHQRHTRDIS